jgi:hypothetical protein
MRSKFARSENNSFSCGGEISKETSILAAVEFEERVKGSRHTTFFPLILPLVKACLVRTSMRRIEVLAVGWSR